MVCEATSQVLDTSGGRLSEATCNDHVSSSIYANNEQLGMQ